MAPQNDTCKGVPTLLSSFIDTFVDFSVSGGLFLLPPQPSQNDENATTRFPSPSRLVAIGDLHGDLEKSKQAFRLAGLITPDDRWSGGSATVVQVGDVLDRGGEELKILYFLEKLKREAARCGGSLITMNGNHEIMNIEADFRYVTEAALEEFKDWAFWYCVGDRMKSLCVGLGVHDTQPDDVFHGIPKSFRGVKDEFFDGFRARLAALRPGGPIASRFFSTNETVLVVGDSVFVHGGLLPSHVKYGLEKINEEVRDWIRGSLKRKRAPEYCKGRDAVVWLRKFSEEAEEKCDCEGLEHVLATIPGARRMVMGHTIQESGISAACGNKAIRIDVGMSKGCINGLPEVLEITGNSGLRVLTSNPLYQNKSYSEANSKAGIGLPMPENLPKQVEVNA